MAQIDTTDSSLMYKIPLTAHTDTHQDTTDCSLKHKISLTGHHLQMKMLL